MKACLELQGWNLHCILGPSTFRLSLNSCFNGDLENVLNKLLNTFTQFLRVLEWHHTLRSGDHSLSLTGLTSKAQRSLMASCCFLFLKPCDTLGEWQQTEASNVAWVALSGPCHPGKEMRTSGDLFELVASEALCSTDSNTRNLRVLNEGFSWKQKLKKK